RVELGLHARQLRFLQRQRAFGGVGDVVQLVIIGLAAQRRHALGAERDAFLEGLFEEGVEPGVLALGLGGGGRGRGGLGHHGGRGGAERQDGGGRNQKTTHEKDPPRYNKGRTVSRSGAWRKPRGSFPSPDGRRWPDRAG